MPKLIDLSGKKFGRLFVVKKGKYYNKKIYWECRCDCGNRKTIRGDCLTSSNTTSCGCFCKEEAKKRFSKNYRYAASKQVYCQYKKNPTAQGHV